MANDGRAIDGMLSDGMLGMLGKLGMLIDGIEIDGMEIDGIAGSDGSVIPDSHFLRARGGAGTISLFVPPKNDRATRGAGAEVALTAGAGAAGFRNGDASSLMRRSTSGPSRLSAAMMSMRCASGLPTREAAGSGFAPVLRPRAHRRNRQPEMNPLRARIV